jgi:hypothetical protein
LRVKQEYSARDNPGFSEAYEAVCKAPGTVILRSTFALADAAAQLSATIEKNTARIVDCGSVPAKQ